MPGSVPARCGTMTLRGEVLICGVRPFPWCKCKFSQHCQVSEQTELRRNASPHESVSAGSGTHCQNPAGYQEVPLLW